VPPNPRSGRGSRGGTGPCQHGAMALNVLGGELQTCSLDPLTGYRRDGCCDTAAGDTGVHTVCAVMSDEFLAFTRQMGNDLSTPRPEWGFAGLRAGDRWCLCAPRWQEAFGAGRAPSVVLAATHELSVEWCDRAALIAHAVDPPAPSA
jgi:uncharacterized protein (DUF2237 family)